MRAAAVLAMLAAIGCGEDGDGTCAPINQTATYRVTYVEQAGGTCGELGTVVVDMAAPDDSGCVTVSRTADPNGCGVSFTRDCTDPPDTTITGKIYVARDGYVTKVLLSILSPVCQSTYLAAYTRL